MNWAAFFLIWSGLAVIVATVYVVWRVLWESA